VWDRLSQEYINAKRAGELFGKSPSRAAKLARDHYEEGHEWPVKVGRQWMAPEQAWEQILIPKHRRRKPSQSNEKEKELITASEASRRLQRNSNWIAELGKRNKRRGGEWPKKIGRYWLAPIEEWKRIANMRSLRAWKRKKNK